MAKALIQGASRGLGLQFSKALVANGIPVIACCRNPKDAKELMELKDRNPTLVNTAKLDVTDEENIKDVSHYVQSEHDGKLDLVINCSGILHPSGRGETNLKEVSFEGLQATFAVNCFGPLMIGRYFAPFLQASPCNIGKNYDNTRHTGILVNMSARVGSVADNRLGGWYSYRMSKSALNMATKNLSIELGRGMNKVVCVALHPGTVDTDLSRPYHRNVPEGKLFSTEKAVNDLLVVINNLSLEDTGKYFDYDGNEIPY